MLHCSQLSTPLRPRANYSLKWTAANRYGIFVRTRGSGHLPQALELMAVDSAYIERTWIAVAPDGIEHDLILRVGLPKPRPEGDWVAAVSLGALDSHQFEIHGMDSWQAMELGMQHVAVLTRHYQSKGWRFLWERGGEEASPKDLGRGA